MQNNTAFDKILSVNCSEDIKIVIEEWNSISQNLKNVNSCLNINLPSMLWYVKHGVGITRLLSLICDFLVEKGNLIKFSGETDFFEFYLDYCDSQPPLLHSQD